MPASQILVSEAVIEFHDYRLDRNLRRLARNGEHIKLSRKLFGTLEYLVINSDRVVSKDELLGNVWPGEHPVRNTVEQVVTRLRRQFADDPANPRFIETVPGQGYRWIAPLTFPKSEIDSQVAPEETALEPTENQREAKPRASLFRRLLNVLAGEFKGEAQLPVVQITPPVASFQALTGSPGRVPAILRIAFAVAIAHAILWALAERLPGWNFREGILLPQGFSAVVLSLTMTVPLIVVPPLYERLFHIRIVSSRHWLGGALIMVFSASVISSSTVRKPSNL